MEKEYPVEKYHQCAVTLSHIYIFDTLLSKDEKEAIVKVLKLLDKLLVKGKHPLYELLFNRGE